MWWCHHVRFISINLTSYVRHKYSNSLYVQSKFYGNDVAFWEIFLRVFCYSNFEQFAYLFKFTSWTMKKKVEILNRISAVWNWTVRTWNLLWPFQTRHEPVFEGQFHARSKKLEHMSHWPSTKSAESQSWPTLLWLRGGSKVYEPWIGTCAARKF